MTSVPNSLPYQAKHDYEDKLRAHIDLILMASNEHHLAFSADAVLAAATKMLEVHALEGILDGLLEISEEMSRRARLR